MNGPTTERPTRLRRRLVRSRRERMLAGVAGGIAEVYGLDPVLVRLAFVAASLLGGAGLVLYLAAWVLVPEEPPGPEGSGGPGPASTGTRRATADDAWLLASVALICLGGLLAAGMFGWRRPDVVWPLALIGAGAAVLWLRARDRTLPAPPTPSAGAGAGATIAPAAGATGGAGAPGDAGADTTEPGAPSATKLPLETTGSAWPPPSNWPTWPPTAPPATRPRPRPFLGPLTLSVLLIGTGVVSLLHTTGAVSVDPGIVVEVALIVVGVALVVGTWFGRARGLLLLGLLLLPIAGGLAFLEVPLRGGIGDRVARPLVRSDLPDRYELAMGSLTVDLTDLDLDLGEAATRVSAQVAMGELVVVVPEDVAVDVTGRTDAGEVVLFGRRDEGVDVESFGHFAGREGAGLLRLDVRVGFGSVQVRREEAPLRATEGSRP